MIMKLDHISFAVKSIEKALSFYRDVLGGVVVRNISDGYNPDFRFLQFILGGQKFELIEPIREGFLEEFLRKRGEGVHHIGFMVDDMEKAINFLEERDVKIVDKFTDPSGWKTAFISPRSTFGVLIQINEIRKK